MKIIAVEEHWGTPETEELRDRWVERVGLPGTKNHVTRAENLKRLWDFDARIPVMDKLGITQQVISLSSPGVQCIFDPEEAVATAKRLNDYQAELMARFPGRFMGFANLPLRDPKGSADELERCVKTHGYTGALIQGHCEGVYLDDKSYYPLWESAQANNALISMHITDPTPDQMKSYKDYPLLSGPTWSWGVEAATHALRIIVGGIFDLFPNASLVLGHMGEGLPYLLGRLEEGARIIAGKDTGTMKKRFIDYMRNNVYITTSGGYFPETMKCAISALGEDRIFFAVDYPFASIERALKQIDDCNLTETQKEKIFYKNFLNAIGR
jgi:2,3-dihydroxybenzoate decarboxylase